MVEQDETVRKSRRRQVLTGGSHQRQQKQFSIIGSHKTKSVVEITANIIFIVCAFVAIIAVLAITVYMIYSGAPALFKVGILDILFGTTWAPTAEDPSFGILVHYS